MTSEAQATATLRQSRVGKRPVALPGGVTAAVSGSQIQVKGPKGQLSRDIPNGVSVKVDGSNVVVTPQAPGRNGPRLQGLMRALIQGMVDGAATGYTRTLQLVGTGYRAEVKGTKLNLSLGFSHPVNFELPTGIKAEVPGDSKGTIIVLTGADKQVIGQTAAKIRNFRPPEPYGGKGVRFQGERVRQKAGKAGKGGK